MRDSIKNFFIRNHTVFTVKNKTINGFDPVTEADKSAEKAMINVLKQMRPSDAVLGEEFGELKGEGPYRWILDPIDGTSNFIHGIPHVGIIVAKMINNEISKKTPLF